MQIVVTGGTGFLGSHLVAGLQREGHQVRVVSRAAGYDVRDLDSLLPAFRGADAVFHLAALVSSREGDFSGINVRGLKNVLTASRQEGVARTIYVSSFTVFGGSGDRPHSEESLDARQSSDFFHAYDRSKFEGWQEARRRRGDLDLDIVFPTIIYGPGPLTEGNLVVRLLRRWQRYRLAAIPSADPCWNFVFVADVAEALVRILGAPPGQDLILGGENARPSDLVRVFRERSGLKIRELKLGRKSFRLGATLENLFVSPPLLSPSTVEFFFQDWRFDSSRAERLLAYSPRPLSDGIGETWKWMRGNQADD